MHGSAKLMLGTPKGCASAKYFPEIVFVTPEIVSVSMEIVFVSPEIVSVSMEIVFVSPEIVSVSPAIVSVSMEIVFVSMEIVLFRGRYYIRSVNIEA